LQDGFGALTGRILKELCRVLTYTAAAILGLSIFYIALGVIARYIFNRPFRGDFEIIVLCAGIVGSFGLAYALMEDAHIRIDIVTQRFPRRPRLVLNVVTYFFGFAFWGIIAWASTIYAFQYKASNWTTGLWEIPQYPFAFAVSAGIYVLCLVFVWKLVKSVAEVAKK
jgi:TRAP-type C4-dicarboxylate transport system permease small subunit